MRGVLLALKLAGLALLAAASAAVWVAFAPAGDASPHPFNHDRNAGPRSSRLQAISASWAS